MDDKTLQALTVLANKLGTTAEYLWGVLVRQAPITGVIDLCLTVGLLFAAACWYRFVKAKTTKPPKTEEDRHPEADWHDEGKFFGWISVALLCAIVGVVVVSTLSTTVAALVNPEYWALRQLLGR